MYHDTLSFIGGRNEYIMLPQWQLTKNSISSCNVLYKEFFALFHLDFVPKIEIRKSIITVQILTIVHLVRYYIHLYKN